MKPTVYIETTIVSYLTAWQSTDSLLRAHQEVTRSWWRQDSQRFSLCTSRFTLDEAGAGDPVAAQERVAALSGIRLLQVGENVATLARAFLATGALPQKAYFDALHVAVAATNAVEFLVTWNCKHLANVMLWSKIEQTCQSVGFVAPRICTPLELTGAADEF